MVEPIIQLKNVSFRYPESKFSIHCDNLVLRKKEVTLFIGENGSGKTTLLKLCCGILKPDEGQLFINGENANKWPLGKIGKNIGYLFQEPSRQLFTATVWEEMNFAGRILGEDSEKMRKKAADLLNQVSMMALADRSIYRLSRGEKQRLAIAAILMQDIQYLILDEPTTGLDSEQRASLYGLLERLIEGGLGIAIISHDKNVISNFNSRKIEIVKGGIVNEKS